VTELEVEEAIREAWAVVQAGPGAPASARRLAVALLALTTGSPAQPHWATPDDLWRDRLAAWGPRPGEPGCRVPPALLPEARARREGAYALWRSAVRTRTDGAGEGQAPPGRGARSRPRGDGTGQAGPARKKAGRGKPPAPEPDGSPR